MKDTVQPRFRAAPDCVSCAYGDGIAILDLRSNTYFSLNDVGALIWARLETDASLPDLIALVADTYDVTAEVCGPDVDSLLSDLGAQGLIQSA